MLLPYDHIIFNVPKEIKHCAGIYTIKSLFTADMYIGKTNDFKLRCLGHNASIHGIYGNGPIYGVKHIWDYHFSFGMQTLMFEVFELCNNAKKRDRLEKRLIAKLKPSLNSIRYDTKLKCSRYSASRNGNYIPVTLGI